ncbi:MAG TPA: phytoene dehydrogenase, partial [Desulfoprunum sp.]|nr:phytoene dehydrogenase [Desulfoprunum sp.]
GIKKDEQIADIGDLLFTSTAPEFDSRELLDLHTRSKTFSLYYPKTRPGHDRYTIVASMNSRFEDWKNMDDEQYAGEKQRLIERTVADLSRYLPDIRTKIDWIEAATPRTFNHYTLHTCGTSFGTKFEGLDVSRSIFREIGGLFHVGSVGIIMSGWLGAINYGVIVANDADGYLRSLRG